MIAASDLFRTRLPSRLSAHASKTCYRQAKAGQRRKQQDKRDEAESRKPCRLRPREQRRNGDQQPEQQVPQKQRYHPAGQNIARTNRETEQQLIVLRLKQLRLCREHRAEDHQRKRRHGVHRKIEPAERKLCVNTCQRGKARVKQHAERGKAVKHQKEHADFLCARALFLAA